MMYNYARVSTQDQNLDQQLDALKKSGCTKIFKEKISAAKERPDLYKMMGLLEKGDCIVVWKPDRLGRSLRHLIDMVKSSMLKSCMRTNQYPLTMSARKWG